MEEESGALFLSNHVTFVCQNRHLILLCEFVCVWMELKMKVGRSLVLEPNCFEGEIMKALAIVVDFCRYSCFVVGGGNANSHLNNDDLARHGCLGSPALFLLNNATTQMWHERGEGPRGNYGAAKLIGVDYWLADWPVVDESQVWWCWHCCSKMQRQCFHKFGETCYTIQMSIKFVAKWPVL